jgi:hypothetical protein
MAVCRVCGVGQQASSYTYAISGFRSVDAPGRFRNSQSDNTSGRPEGARNRSTLLAVAVLDGEAVVALVRQAIDLAKAGDVVALRLCIEQLVPKRMQRISEPKDAIPALSRNRP